MSTIFSRIISGELPCHKILENENFISFLDISPLAIGHVLVVPKKEIDYIYDLPDELLGNLFVFSKKVATAIEKAIPCERIGIAVIGLEVPHAHVHLIPLNSVNDINFSLPKMAISNEKLEMIAQQIREQL